MDEAKRKQAWMQELNTAAKGNDMIAEFAKSAIQCCNDGIPWAGVFNYGAAKSLEGRKLEQEEYAKDLLNLILVSLFHPDSEQCKEEIRRHFEYVTDTKAKDDIDYFIRGLETVGKTLQAFEEMDTIDSTDLKKMKQQIEVYREGMHSAMSERDEIKKKMSGRQVITQELAAERAGVSVRTIKRWDRGEGAPWWYAGRNMSLSVFIQRVKMRNSERKEKEVAKDLKNPSRLTETMSASIVGTSVDDFYSSIDESLDDSSMKKHTK